MATAVTTNNVAKDESMSAENVGRGDLTAEIEEQDQILQMVDSGFDSEKVLESSEYRLSMEMLDDAKLKGQSKLYEKLVSRLSAWYVNNEKIRINGGMTEEQIEIVKKTGYS